MSACPNIAKTCNQCGVIKPIEEFPRNQGRRRSKCRPCYNEYHRPLGRAEYQRNKPYYLTRKQKNKIIVSEYINSLKENTPCVDCGENYPFYVMDFDHLENKENEINRMKRNTNIVAIKKEIAKCEIVCANCHRIRTYKRLLP